MPWDLGFWGIFKVKLIFHTNGGKRFGMGNVRRIYVEKKAPFAVKAKELKEEIGSYLQITSVTGVREFIRYDVENVSDAVFEKACHTVFSEPPVDILYQEKIEIPEDAGIFNGSYW